MQPEDVIVVGVDGTTAGEVALRYAAVEADRLGVGLRLVHVVPDMAALAGSYATGYALAPVETEQLGHSVLDAAQTRAAELVGPDRVSVSLVAGSRVAALVTAADRARLTVLGDQHRPVLDRLATGSVLAGVAARARTPVIAVPANWRPATAHDTVVVAVKDCERSGALVHRAMAVAADRKARLVLLHAWQLPTLYDDLIAERVDADFWTDDVTALLQHLVEAQRHDLPDVEVEYRVEHGRPAQVIVAASRGADLLLVARRPHLLPAGHLGGVGRAVLREALCPVEVLPPADQPDEHAERDAGSVAAGTSVP